MIKNKCKKIVSAIMLMTMIAIVFSTNVFAYCSFDDDCEELFITDDERYSFNKSTGELVISGEGKIGCCAEMEYECYEPRHRWEQHELKSVKINNGITMIGDCEFRNSPRLKSVTIPNSVKRIGQFTFFNCKSLKSITIPNSVTTIGVCAFAECTGLTKVTYQGKSDPIVTRNDFNLMSSHVFDDCPQLNEVKVPIDYKGDTFCGIKVTKE